MNVFFKTPLALSLLLGASIAHAQSGTVSGNYVGCTSKESLSEFISAAVANDSRQMSALLGTSCININGLSYSIVSRGIVRSQLRVYSGSNSVVLWTPSEAAR